jgi:hypothetical protein
VLTDPLSVLASEVVQTGLRQAQPDTATSGEACDHKVTRWREGWFGGYERVCECGEVVEVTDCS